MTDQTGAHWENERKVLLDLIAAHPSQEMAEERERLVLLNKLIAERVKHPIA